jgi:hypothetical protein
VSQGIFIQVPEIDARNPVGRDPNTPGAGGIATGSVREG